MNKDSIYFPPGIWGKITSFLGKDYWYNRQQLTYLSQVIDLYNSDYKFSSYWLWNPWRQKEQNNWYLNRTLRKPEIPERFMNYRDNPYISNIDPPIINHDTHNIDNYYDKHVNFRDLVFGFHGILD
mgnify:CR=1 FL=1|tara:strand:+ start:7252 stop:7629 length:378 start_codon:yes stop_codon:yes gene_type:complete